MPHPISVFNGRHDELRELARSGLTLQQIGDRFGVTRERARQVLNKIGVDVSDRCGAIRKRAKEESKNARKALRRDMRAMRWYGCTYEELVALNGSKKTSTNGCLAHRYTRHRTNSATRGIEFRLTFPQWVKVWADSGHLHERGRGRGHYVMSRFADKGAYVVGNVFIQLSTKNNSEGTLAARARGCYENAYKRRAETRMAA